MIALVVSALLLAANAFFVALEFSLVGSRRTRIEELADEGDRRGRRALAAIGDLNLQLSGAQLGITMASLGLGFIAEPALAEVLDGLFGRVVDLPSGVSHAIAFVIALAVVVFLHMVFGEMVPKNVALVDPERTLLRLAGANRAYVTLLRPVIWLLTKLSNAGVRLVGYEPRSELATARTADELALMLAESHGEGYIEDFAHDLMAGALHFGGRDAESVMVPRDAITAVSRDASVADVEDVVVRSGHSRIVVADDGDLDRVLGFVHSKDLLALGADEAARPLPLGLVRRMLVVPRRRSLEDLLRSMRTTRIHTAMVVEDNGATAGLVTLEDLLEELVGEITDESDRSVTVSRPAAGT